MEQKTVYCYDSETGEFKFSDVAFEDELNPGTFLLPPDCTEVEPNPPQGTAAVWNGKAWDYIEDHRGQKYWLSSSKYGDFSITMTELGALPDGALLEMPQPEIGIVKKLKLQEINDECDRILTEAVSAYPQSEILTFDQQIDEVEKYLSSGSPSDAPLLTALAAARGIELDDLCGRIIDKRTAFSQLSGLVIGQRQRLEDILDTLETVEAVQALEVDISLLETPNEETEAADESGFFDEVVDGTE